MDKELYITDFQNVDEAITFAKKYWFNQDLAAIKEMQAIQAEKLEEGAGWSCMIGICDICREGQVTFLPTCIFEDEITGVECFNCKNMSVYPKEKEEEYES